MTRYTNRSLTESSRDQIGMQFLPLASLTRIRKMLNSLTFVMVVRPNEVCHESAFEREANLRKLQAGEKAGSGVRHLHQPASQAASRLINGR